MAVVSGENDRCASHPHRGVAAIRIARHKRAGRPVAITWPTARSAIAAPPTRCDSATIGIAMLSTSGARSRLVIRAPDSINSSQATSAHETGSFGWSDVFMRIASRRFAGAESMKRHCLLTSTIACLVVLPMSARPRLLSQDQRATPDISGFWELGFDRRNVPRASLLPAGTRAQIDAHARKDADAIRWCHAPCVPFV